MRGIILALLLALAGSENPEIELVPSENRISVFNYEAIILNGLPENDLPQAGIKFTCKVEISRYTQGSYLLKTQSPEIKEYNGLFPKDPFTRSPKLTQAIADELTKPVRFEYHNGRMGEIQTAESVSDLVGNLQKGILNLLPLTLKKNQNVYDILENSIAGVCQTKYTIAAAARGDVMSVIKSTDFNSCQEKVSKSYGFAFLEPCLSCKEMNRNLQEVATYSYKLKARGSRAVIMEVRARQLIRFTPFNQLQGAAVMEAKQVLIYEGTKKSPVNPPQLQLQKSGSLHYSFGKEFFQMPFLQPKIKNAASKIMQVLEYLVQNNLQDMQGDTAEKYLELVNLVRVSGYEILQSIFKQVSSKLHFRRLLLEAISEAGTTDALSLIKQEIHNGELLVSEAATAISRVVMASRASPSAIKIFKDLLEDPRVLKSQTLYKAAMLSYGSLVKKYCSHLHDCPEDVLEPLHNLAADAASKVHHDDIATALKALGNAAQGNSIKRIVKFLPGISSRASQLPVRLQTDAVMALRNIGKKDPHRVQEILLPLYMNQDLRTEVRLMAVLALFETKPSQALVTSIAAMAAKETKGNLQVASFVHSQMTALSNSRIPQLEPLAAACSTALKLLNPQIERLGSRYSKVLRYDYYNYNLMSGAAAKVYILNSRNSMSPVFVLVKIRVYVGGHEADVLEVGLRGEGIEEVLRKQNIPFADFPMRKKIAALIKTVVGFKALSRQEPFMSGYAKVLSQEVGFLGMTKDVIQNIVQALNEPIEQHAMVKHVINNLLNGFVGQYVRPMMNTEIRHIVPTTVGFPMELSLYLTSVVHAAIKADMKVTPTPSSDFSLSQLLRSQVHLNTDVNLSLLYNAVATVGINTHMIQSGIEYHGKIHTNLPAKFTAQMDMKANNLKIENAPIQQEHNIVQLSASAFAVSRNAENPEAAKKTLIVSRGANQNILKKHFETTERNSGEGASMMEVSSETKRYVNLAAGIPNPYPDPQEFKLCFKIPKLPAKMCLHKHSKHAGSKKSSCIYQMTGQHYATFSVKPADDDEAVAEKIQTEISLGSQAASRIIALVNTDNEAPEQMDESAIRRTLKTILGIDEEFTATNESLRQKHKKHHHKNKPHRHQKYEHKHRSAITIEMVKASRKPASSSSSSSSLSSRSRSSSSSSSSNYASSSSSHVTRPKSNIRNSQNRQHSAVGRDGDRRIRQQNQEENDDRRTHNRKRSSSSSSSSTGSSSSSSSSESRRLSSSSSSRSSSSSTRNNRSSRSSSSSSSSSSRNDRSSRSSSSRSSVVHRESRNLRRSSRSNSNLESRVKHRNPEYERGNRPQHGDKIRSSSSGYQARHEREFYDLRFLPAHRQAANSGAAKRVSSSSSSSSSSGRISRQSTSRRQERFLGDNKPPVLVLTVKVIRNDDKRQGFQIIVYTDYHANKPHVQVYMVDLKKSSRQRACFDAVVVSPHEAKATLKFGQNCQDYKISVKASTGLFGNQPALKVNVNYPKIPSQLKSLGKLASKYLPGLAYMMRFSQVDRRNPSHQTTIIVALVTPRTVNVVIKVPKATLYRTAALTLPIPIPARFDSKEATMLAPTFAMISEVPQRVLEAMQGECSVSYNQITTFNGVNLAYALPENCYHILAQDCSEELKFMLMVKNDKDAPDRKDLNLKVGMYNIDFYTLAGSLKIKINGIDLSEDQLPYISFSELKVEIHKMSKGVSVRALPFGIEELSYDGSTVKLRPTLWMKGKMCGLCGQNDDETEQQFKRPDGSIAPDQVTLIHSWMLSGESCSNGCNVEHSLMIMDHEREERKEKCYSVQPVLQCRKGCSPVKATAVSSGFHCVPAESALDLVPGQLRLEKTQDFTQLVEAYTACSCETSPCPA